MTRRRRSQTELRRFRRDLVAVLRDTPDMRRAAPRTRDGSAARDTDSRGAARK